MTKVLCSVIIPVYNGERYILDCLRSLTEEENFVNSIEIIVSDDGSTDNTVSVIQEEFKDKRFIKVIKCEHGGHSSARNIGIKNATGDYLLFIDSDDMVGKNFWTGIIPLLQSNKWDVIYFRCKSFFGELAPTLETDPIPQNHDIVIDAKQEQHLKACSLYYDAQFDQPSNLLYGLNASMTMGKCWRRQLQAESDVWWDSDVKLHADGIFLLHMLYYCKNIIYTNKSSYLRRIRCDSNSNVVRNNTEKLFEIRNKRALTILKDLYGLTLEDTNNEFIQRYYCSIVYQIGVILEKDIFNKNISLSLFERRKRFYEIKKAYGPQNLIFGHILSNHEKKMINFYKKSFIYDYIYILLRDFYHATYSKIRRFIG